MKVLQVNNFHHIRGGSDKAYFDISKLLVQNGHKVIHFSSLHSKNISSEYAKYFVPEINFFESQTFSSKIKAANNYLNNKTAAKNLQQLIDVEKPDIAHLHIFQSRLSSSILPVFVKNKIPVVMQVHEYKMLCPIYKLRDNSGNICEACSSGKYQNAFLKKCNRDKISFSALSAIEAYYTRRKFNWLKHIDHFIMVSDFIRSKHIEYFPKIEEKSSRLYNFIDTDRLPPKKSESNYFIYTGRLSSEKGIDTLLKAWSKLPNLHLKIIGTGDYESELKELSNRLHLNNVEFLGFQKNDKLLNEVAGAKYFIIPSEWYENNPLSVIESLAIGTPVLGSNIGGIPELVNNERGFLFNPFDVEDIVSTLEKVNNLSPDQYYRMSANGKQFILENMNKENFYTQLLSIYQKQLN